MIDIYKCSCVFIDIHRLWLLQVRQLDMIAHTALRHASAAAADGGAEATQAHTAAMFMKSAVTATTDAVAAVDKAAMDMEEV